MTPERFRIFPDAEILERTAAEEVQRACVEAIHARNEFLLVLSGGNTPLRIFDHLASMEDPFDWKKIHFFWSDERFVPSSHPESNEGSARRHLLDRVPVPEANIHPMYSDCDLSEAAHQHELVLRNFMNAKDRLFDLVLLGIGEDGHTASLFPGSASLKENTRWILDVSCPLPIRERLTMTLPLLLRSRSILILAPGKNKARPVRAVLASLDNKPPELPAAILLDSASQSRLWVDRDSAG